MIAGEDEARGAREGEVHEHSIAHGEGGFGYQDLRPAGLHERQAISRAGQSEWAAVGWVRSAATRSREDRIGFGPKRALHGTDPRWDPNTTRFWQGEQVRAGG
jgi:hypothetical protein